ncbi:aldo/keto reductase [Streptosporangium sp. NPDC001559]|uniref:aldo/keto reductase n=1 Tax=Streptosporangium sp. NPDC001559 TaxID=3366187 RepID=UPI0036E6B729
MMRYHSLGVNGPKVSALSIGSYHTYDRMRHEDIVEFLTTARNAGVTWFDVGHYTSAARPDDPVSETDMRFAAARDAAGIAREDYFHTEKLWYGGPRPSFRDQLAESLPRARVDAADCVIYNPDTAYYFQTVVDMKDIVRQMAGLVEAGLTRYWGINHATPAEIDEACAYAHQEGMPLPSVLQLPYSAIARKMGEDSELAEVMERWDLVIQTTNVLAVGVLAGRRAAGSERPLGPTGMTRHAEKVRDAFAARAEELGATAAQLAIAFALTHPRTASVLFGASSVEQLKANLGALDLVNRLGTEGVRAAVADLPQNPDELRVGEIDTEPAVG